MMSSCTERRRVDEFDHRGVEHGAIAGISRQPRGHQQHGRADALAAPGLNVFPDARDQLDLRLDVAPELAIDLLEIGADRIEDLREVQRRFLHG